MYHFHDPVSVQSVINSVLYSYMWSYTFVWDDWLLYSNKF